MKKILSLDLGTKTGYCYGDRIDDLKVGTWTLASNKEVTAWRKLRLDRTCDPRIFRLWEGLHNSFLDADLVIFEDVEFFSYLKTVQIWAGLRSAVWLGFKVTTRFECVPVGTLKKFATGHGNATKQMMSKALASIHQPFWNRYGNLDDNAVDAIWIWLWARQNLGRFLT